MSIQFREPMNEMALNMLGVMFREKLVAVDEKIALVNETVFRSDEMTKLANVAGQPAELILHDEGDIVTMSDSTKYRVGPNGWRRYVEP